MRDYESMSFSRTKLDYLFAKQHGICVNCKTREAEPGKTLCLECQEKSRIKNRRALEKMTEQEKQERYRRNNERYRRVYAERKQKGVCVKCGKRKSVAGRTLCIDCLVKSRRRKDRRYNNEIERNERPEYGLCYVCAQPVCEESASLCRKHYELYAGLMRERNANPTPAMLEHREYIRNLEHARIEQIRERVRNGTFRKI